MIDILKDAFKTAFSKPLTYIALVAIPIIVACFGLLYFNTFLDPYEKMKSMPIAVVNEDTGCTMNDSERNFGNELVERLQETMRQTGPPKSQPFLTRVLKTPTTTLRLSSHPISPNGYQQAKRAIPSRRTSRSLKTHARITCSPASPPTSKTS